MATDKAAREARGKSKTIGPLKALGPFLAPYRLNVVLAVFALISTAGLHRREDPPFTPGAGDYRIIPDEYDMDALTMSHVSTNFDRSGFYQDVNTSFPIDRLRELAAEGVIGSVAGRHFSFMGATPPTVMEPVARDLAKVLKADNVDAVALVPV